MSYDEQDLDRAISLYLGYGSTPAPIGDRRRLEAEFGSVRAAALEESVGQLLRELTAIDVDWSRQSLASMGPLARSILRSRHPELGDTALAALEWKFTFDWR